MADQQPSIGETRTANGETRTWTGQGWAKVSRGLTDPSGAPMIQLPPRGTSGRTDQQDLDVLKNFLNIGGAALTATPFGAASLPLRMGAAALGGAVGRTAGHGIEAMNKAARHDESGPSLGEDIGQGLVEGAGAEVAPAVVSKALGLGGRGLQAAGDFLGSGASPAMRGWIGHTAAGAPGAAAAALGPPAISAVGSGAERAGEAIGTRTLSQRLSDALEGFTGGPSSGDLEALRRSRAAYNWGQGQEIPYRGPSGGGVSPTTTSPSMEALFRNEPPPIAAPSGGGYSAERMATNRAVQLPPEMLQPEELPTHNFQRTQSLAPMKTPQEIGYEGVMRRRGAGLAQAMEGEVPVGAGGAESAGQQPSMTINDVEIPASLRPFYGTPTLEDQMTRELQTLLPQQSRLPAYR